MLVRSYYLVYVREWKKTQGRGQVRWLENLLKPREIASDTRVEDVLGLVGIAQGSLAQVANIPPASRAKNPGSAIPQ
jgi:hypothetical protein